MRSGCLLLALFLSACSGSSDPRHNNNSPVAFDDQLTLDEDASVEGRLNATDTDGDPIVFSVGRAPARGLIEVSSDGAFTYQPDADFFGVDSFEYLVADSAGASDVGTVTFVVSSVNDPPVAADQQSAGSEDSEIRLMLDVVDVDDTALSYRITDNPQHGSAHIVDGELWYTPDRNFYGNDTLAYEVDDGELNDEAVLEIEILSVDDPPVIAVNGDDYTSRGGVASLDASASSDVEGAPLTFLWEQTSGPIVALTNTTGPYTEFSAPTDVARIGLRLTVSDGQLVSEELLEIGVADWLRVAAGRSHALALREDGSLWAWGENRFGQLGDGSTVDSPIPKLIDSSEMFVSVAAGYDTSYALRDDGVLFAFGNGESGQMGNGEERHSSIPTIVDGGPYAMVTAGSQYAIGLKTDGTLWSWGVGEISGLGRWTVRLTNPEPGQIGSESSWTDVAAGQNTASGRKSDGTLWSWGGKENGEIGDGSTEQDGVNVAVEAVQIRPGESWSSVFRGYGVLLAVRDDKTLWGAGRNEFGSLGLGFTGADEPTLRQVGTDSDWQAGCVNRHTLALKLDGALWAWGANTAGERGDPDFVDSGVPRRIGTASDWKAVACGYQSSFAIREDGSLWSWGSNSHGQLGHGDTVDRSTPTRVAD